MIAPPIPQVTLEQYEAGQRDRHLIHSALDFWAERQPDAPAILNVTRDTCISWSELRRRSSALAGALSRMGLRRGDFLAASLPLLDEHILLEYACFRLGVIHAPLDLRLGPGEVLRCVDAIRARAYAFPGRVAGNDFRPLAEAVRGRCGSVEHLIQFSPPSDCIDGATSIVTLLGEDASPQEAPVIEETEGAQVIFTTGSTGSPKPALLSHRGITCQNLCLGTAFRFGPDQKVLCNLPASHVGGQAELLLTSLYMGGCAVTLEVFDPVLSLDAIERYGVTLIGQIPALFQLEWRTAGFASRRFPALRAAVYGGQSVPRPFLDQMLRMAPQIGTGLGLTEASGFCTYTDLTGDADAVAQGIGWAMPVYPLSIRGPMEGGRRAGAELDPGQVGHVCFRGPQNFLGYVNDPESTERTLSIDGWLYTGDMGFADERGLHFSGRAKWVLKPMGYQVFPGDVEDHFASLTDKVANVGVVGHEHQIWSEALVAFIEKRSGADITEAELKKHARGLSSYMRPLHYVILEAGSMPLNRTAKVDVLRLQQMAAGEVAQLRQRGRWDGGASGDQPPESDQR